MSIRLLVVVGEPWGEHQTDAIRSQVTEGLKQWDCEDVELHDVVMNFVNSDAPLQSLDDGALLAEAEGVKFLLNPGAQALTDHLRQALGASASYTYILFAGCTLQGCGSWLLKDAAFSCGDLARILMDPSTWGGAQVTSRVVFSCLEEGNWNGAGVPKLGANTPTVAINPRAASQDTGSFGQALTGFLGRANAGRFIPIQDEMRAARNVGSLRFSQPTFYVFPGGHGDAALFGIAGFTMLFDGGYQRVPEAWNFLRHLDRVDGALVSRASDVASVRGLSSMVRRAAVVGPEAAPKLGHVFLNAPPRKGVPKNKHPLLVSSYEEAYQLKDNLKALSMDPQALVVLPTKGPEPITLYSKIGHGKLDMYVLSPPKDSREQKELFDHWQNEIFPKEKLLDPSVARVGAAPIPVSDAASLAVVIIWQPVNQNDKVVRILYPGNLPQSNLFKALERVKSLESLKHYEYIPAAVAAATKAKAAPKGGATASARAPSGAGAGAKASTGLAASGRAPASAARSTQRQPVAAARLGPAKPAPKAAEVKATADKTQKAKPPSASARGSGSRSTTGPPSAGSSRATTGSSAKPEKGGTSKAKSATPPVATKAAPSASAGASKKPDAKKADSHKAESAKKSGKPATKPAAAAKGSSDKKVTQPKVEKVAVEPPSDNNNLLPDLLGAPDVRVQPPTPRTPIEDPLAEIAAAVTTAEVQPELHDQPQAVHAADMGDLLGDISAGVGSAFTAVKHVVSDTTEKLQDFMGHHEEPQVAVNQSEPPAAQADAGVSDLANGNTSAAVKPPADLKFAAGSALSAEAPEFVPRGFGVGTPPAVSPGSPPVGKILSPSAPEFVPKTQKSPDQPPIIGSNVEAINVAPVSPPSRESVEKPVQMDTQDAVEGAAVSTEQATGHPFGVPDTLTGIGHGLAEMGHSLQDKVGELLHSPTGQTVKPTEPAPAAPAADAEHHSTASDMRHKFSEMTASMHESYEEFMKSPTGEKIQHGLHDAEGKFHEFQAEAAGKKDDFLQSPTGQQIAHGVHAGGEKLHEISTAAVDRGHEFLQGPTGQHLQEGLHSGQEKLHDLGSLVAEKAHDFEETPTGRHLKEDARYAYDKAAELLEHGKECVTGYMHPEGHAAGDHQDGDVQHFSATADGNSLDKPVTPVDQFSAIHGVLGGSGDDSPDLLSTTMDLHSKLDSAKSAAASYIGSDHGAEVNGNGVASPESPHNVSASALKVKWGDEEPLGLPVAPPTRGVPKAAGKGGPPPAASSGAGRGARRPAPGASGTSKGASGSAAPKKSPPPNATYYFDLAYIPKHGSPNYVDEDFFTVVRSKHYVLSGLTHDKATLDALLAGKKAWNQPQLETNLIPTYDSDNIQLWLGLNQSDLASQSIDVKPSAVRCTLNLSEAESDETQSKAYRLEF